MALTGTYVQDGYAVPNSYVLARNQNFIAPLVVNVTAEVYPSQQAAATWAAPLFIVNGAFNYDPNAADNVYAQSYNYLLTLPQFQGFIPA